jgi:hypothetical protein
VHLTINTPELKKLPGVVCKHCTEVKGCAIYEARPAACRSYHCGWRYLPALDDAWRPDRSGILMDFVDDEIPPGYESPMAVRFHLVSPVKSAAWPPFISYVAYLISNRMPVFLRVAGNPGHVATKIFLNPIMSAAVASRDMGRATTILREAAEACVNLPTPKVQLD